MCSDQDSECSDLTDSEACWTGKNSGACVRRIFVEIVERTRSKPEECQVLPSIYWLSNELSIRMQTIVGLRALKKFI